MKQALSAAALTALLISAQASAKNDSASFCARLAPQLDMKPDLSKAAIGHWRVGMFSFMQIALTGGVASVSFELEPIDPTDEAERLRLRGSCIPTKQGIGCKIQGPTKLTLRVKDKTAVIEAAPDERAELELRKTTFHCRDG